MVNCLVKKLKTVINNDNLFKRGEYPVSLYPLSGSGDTPANRKVVIAFSEEVTMRCLEGNFVDSSDVSQGTTLTCDAETQTTFYLSNAATVVIDFSKLVYLDCEYCKIMNLPLKHFEYSTDIFRIVLPYRATGDMNSLATLTKMSYFSCYGSGSITGSIAGLAGSKGTLQRIRASASSITGDLSSLIGLSNCTINLPESVTYSQATYNTLTAAGCTIAGGTPTN